MLARTPAADARIASARPSIAGGTRRAAPSSRRRCRPGPGRHGRAGRPRSASLLLGRLRGANERSLPVFLRPLEAPRERRGERELRPEDEERCEERHRKIPEQLTPVGGDGALEHVLLVEQAPPSSIRNGRDLVEARPCGWKRFSGRDGSASVASTPPLSSACGGRRRARSGRRSDAVRSSRRRCRWASTPSRSRRAR